MSFYMNLASKFPELDSKLSQARMAESPEKFLKRIVKTSFMASLGLCVVLFLFFKSVAVLLALPILLLFMFAYFKRIPDIKIAKYRRGISREIVFAGRFLIIELEAGVPPYEAFKNMARNYKVIGIYFQEMVSKIALGTSIEDAINETIENVPSDELKKILWQVLNAISTGSEVVESLKMVVEQIVREQQIAVEAYGKKLNPLAMFYMMVAVIIPSLGVTMLVILLTFLSIKLSLPLLLGLSFMLGFVQFMFLSMIKSSRPAVEL